MTWSEQDNGGAYSGELTALLGAELYTQAMADAKLLVASLIIKSSGSQGSDAIRKQAADGLPPAPSAAPMCASPGYFSSPAN